MMNAFLNRLFRLREGEAALVFSLGFVLFVNSLALQVSGIVGLSGFLNADDVSFYLLLLGVNYFLILLITGWQSLTIDRFDRREMVGWVAFIFAGVFVLIRLMFAFHAPDIVSYGAMFVMSEVQVVVFPLVFWILASDIFPTATSRRLFPVVASFGIAGKLAGIGVAWAFPRVTASLGIAREEVIAINILLYMLAFVVIRWRLAHTPIRETNVASAGLRETLQEAWGFIQEVPAFRYLMIAILGLTIADTIIEFRFFVITDAAYAGADDFQAFFSLYRLVITLLALMVQGFITSRLINWLGLKNAFILLPVITLMASLAMLFFPGGPAGVVAAIGAMASVKLLRDTVAESSRKSFQGLVPEERRGRVSLFMDSYLPACGTILGVVLAGGVVFVGIRLNVALVYVAYLGITIAAALLAIWAVLQMRRTYDSSMLNWRLKRRQRGASVLDKLQFD